MTDFIYILFLSAVVIYADWRMTAHNWNVPFNGLGSIVGVLRRTSKQPMQYRVLVPWMCGLYKYMTNNSYMFFYVWVRWLAIIFSLYTAHLWFGSQHYTALLALFFIAAAIYDYTDGYLEVGFYALFFHLMTTHPIYYRELMCVVVFLATLNRETSVFMPVIALLSMEWVLAGGLFLSFGLSYLIPRVYYGKVERYCSFVMFKKNMTMLKNKVMISEYILFCLLLVLVGIAGMSFGGSPIQIGMGLMFLSLLIPCVWAEIRVFKPVMLVVIPMILG